MTTTTTKEQKPKYAILITPHRKLDRTFETDTLCLSIVKVCADDEIRNPETESGYENLQFTCCFSWREGKFETYGWSLEYRGYLISELRDAERMAKTLRRAAAVHKRFAVTPASFGQYVSLMAQGLGIKHYASEGDRRTAGPATGFYRDNSYRIGGVRDIEFAVNRELVRLQELVLPAPQCDRCGRRFSGVADYCTCPLPAQAAAVGQ